VTSAARFDRLWLGHWPAPAANSTLPAAAASRAFVLDTCLRRLVLTDEPELCRALAPLQPPERFTGLAAYRFLLEVTTGLRSAVPGETNVFGQFKRAWEAYRVHADRQAVASLAPVIAAAIRDTRVIRHEHLQGIGGASYGALARRLLQPRAGERVLFVGAGELARSMLAFFRGFEIGVWNRRPAGPAFAAAGRLFAPGEGALAAGWAHHVVMTTPADATNDERWSCWLDASLAQTVLHLGKRRGELVPGPAHATRYDLDDLFDLRHSQDNIRSLQLQRARLACRENARRTALRVRQSDLRFAAG
jgi:hypothetical protein